MTVLDRVLRGNRKRKNEEPAPDVAVAVRDEAEGALAAYAAHRNLLAVGRKKPDKGNDGVWAYYLIPPVPWQHTSTEHRRRVIDNFAHAIASLAPARIWIRGTENPFNLKGWVDDIAARTEATRPEDPDDEEGRTFADYHEQVQRYVQAVRFSKSVTVIGVRITGKRARNSTELGLLFRKEPLDQNRADWESRRRRLIEVDGIMGRIGGVPMQRNWMGWLMHASIGMGLPVPTGLLQSSEYGWEPDQIAGFTKAVYPVSYRMAPTTELHTMRNGVPLTSHVTVVHAQDMRDRDLEEVSLGALVPVLLYPRRFDFPVEFVGVFDLIPPAKLAKHAEVTRRTAHNLAEHYAEHNEPPSILQQVGADQAHRYEDEVLKAPREVATRARGVLMFGMTGPSRDFVLHERVAPFAAEMSREVRTEIESGYDQYHAYRSFIPGEPVNMTGYTSQMSVRTLAGMVPHGDTGLGDRTGVPFGPIGGGNDLMLFDFWGGSRRNKSNLIGLIGDQGGGKSSLMGWMADASASIFGVRTTLTDPSGTMATLTAMPHMRAIARHIDATSARPGTMATSIMVPDPRREDYTDKDEYDMALEAVQSDRRELAMDSLRMLLPPTIFTDANATRAEGLLRSAIRAANAGDYGSDPWAVVARLNETKDDLARFMAQQFEDQATQLGGRQLFPAYGKDLDPDKVNALMDNNLSVLTMPGIEAPAAGVPLAELNTTERASRLLLFLSARFSMRTLYADKRPKMVLSDEAAVSAAGESAYRAFLNRGAVDTRKWNGCLVVGSQNPSHLTNIAPEITNLMGMVIAARHGSDEAAKATLEILGAPANMGYHHELTMLEPGDYLIRDFDRRINTAHLDYGHMHASLVAALDTSPNRELVAAHNDMFEGVPTAW